MFPIFFFLGFISIVWILILIVELWVRAVSMDNWNIVMKHPEKIQEFIDNASFKNKSETSFVIDNSEDTTDPKIIIKNGDLEGDEYIIFYKTALWFSPLMTVTSMLSETSYAKDNKERLNAIKEAFEKAKQKT